MSDGCPTDLFLERFLLGEGDIGARSRTREHLAGCARCQERLSSMERAEAGFRRTSHAVPARQAFFLAERKNRRNLMLAACIPLVVVAAALSPLVLHAPAQQLPLAQLSEAPREVHARRPELLEPRGPSPVPRLRTVSVRGQQVALGTGTLEGGGVAGLPRPFLLKRTDVEVQASVFLQRVTVTQDFENPFSEPVEAVYVFPLPEDAAVDDMELTVGQRVIRGEIHKREEARRRYEEAKSQGKRAALLDQERPNLFTQSVANVQPGERVRVKIRYAARLKYDDGVFELNFPMTVGPRYVPGAPVPGQSQGTGTQPDTSQVLDASRISPPQERTGRDISVRVHLDAGVPLTALSSASHRIWADQPDAQHAEVWLDAADRIPNKDFILRWRAAGQKLQAAALATGQAGSGTFALMLQPPTREAQVVMPKEMVFVIDTSCSMTGYPLTAAKRAMRQAIEQMNPDDTFYLVDFADSASSFSSAPLANRPELVRRALSYLDALPAGGGTNQLAGIRAALARPGDPNRLREVMFMTDGFIGNERAVIAETTRLLGDARLFAFGVGTSVNHYLLQELSVAGRGFYQYIRPDEDPDFAVERFVRRIERPLVTDVSLDFGGMPVHDLSPKLLPDLFDAQPLVVLGRYRGPARGTVTLRGRVGGQVRELLKVDLSLPEKDERHGALSQLWARARIEELDRAQHFGERGDVIREITTLGLEYRLVTAYTSFVAVDQVVARAGTATSVEPTEVPQQTAGEEGRMGRPVTLGQAPAGHRTSPFVDSLNQQQSVGGPLVNRAPTRPVASGLGTGIQSALDSLGTVDTPAASHSVGSVAAGGGSAANMFGGDAAGYGGLGLRGTGRGGGGTGGYGAGGAKPPDTHALAGSGKSGETTRGSSAGVGHLGTQGRGAVATSGVSDGADFSREFGSTGTGLEGKGGNKNALPIGGAPGKDADELGLKRGKVDVEPMLPSAQPQVMGALSKDLLRNVIRAHKEQVRGCYQRALTKNPKLEGRLALRFVIGPDGRVQSADVSQGLLPDLDACMTRQLKTWVFPAPKGGGVVIVTYPFVFSLEDTP